MATIAIFNSKGGVGKSTLAVNLAWEACQSGYRVLLWEVDGQGDSSWLLQDRPGKARLSPLAMSETTKIAELVQPSLYQGLSLVFADPDIRQTDNFFRAAARYQRLAHIFAELEKEHDLIILDCPTGFGEANQTILQFANLILVPITPSALAMRGFLRIRDFLVRHRGSHPPMLPVYSLVDGRRKRHRDALAEEPGWPIIPMLSEIEQVFERRQPLGVFAPKGKGRAAVARLWQGIHAKLRQMRVIRTLPGGGESAPVLRAQPVSLPARPRPGARAWPRYLPEALRP